MIVFIMMILVAAIAGVGAYRHGFEDGVRECVRKQRQHLRAIKYLREGGAK